MKYLWILLLLSGCGAKEQIVVAAPPQVERQYLRDTIPASELKCKDKPKKTGVEVQRGAAKYIAGVENAGDDCRQKLNGVREIVDAEK